MKKQFISLLLACLLLVGLCGSAAAAEIDATILTNLDFSGAEYYESSTTRAAFALFMMMDFYSDGGSRGGDSITDDYDFTSIYLQKWNDQSLYLYVRPNTGTGYYEFNYYHSKGSTYYSVKYDFKTSWTTSTVTSVLEQQNKPYTLIPLSDLGDVAKELSDILD